MPLLMPACKRVPAWLGIAATLMVLLAATLDAAAPTTAGEYHLKAVFLFNFAKFVEWPPQAFGDAHDPFIICLAGANPFGSFLDDEVRGQTVRGRPISIRGVSNPRDARTCQILFVPASEHKRERGILDSLQGASVLTVGDADDFTTAGGIVQFKQIDARIHIEIVPEAAERANLRISARLLSLATLVRHPL
jgi:YfiR/HmsC-like